MHHLINLGLTQDKATDTSDLSSEEEVVSTI